MKRWIRKHERQTLEDVLVQLHDLVGYLSYQAAWGRDKQTLKATGEFLRRAKRVLEPLDLLGNGEFLDNWLEIRESPDKQCAWCGVTQPLEVDHIIPRSRGGSPHIDNLQLLCRNCNRSKGARTMEEWVQTDNARSKLERT